MTYLKRAILCAGVIVLAQIAISQSSSGSKQTLPQKPEEAKIALVPQTKKTAAPLDAENWQDYGLTLFPKTNKAAKAVTEPEVSSTRVANAMHFRGSRYRYGGLSSRSGFDCSGFVKTVLSEEGISLPRTSGQQASVGVAVRANDLKPGDLVFFHTSRRSRITHVGIYAGDGKFVHAANSRKGVRVDNLGDKYYAKRLVAARRVGK